MILILKDRKQSNGDTEKTIRLLVKKIKKRNIQVEVSSFEEIEISINGEDVNMLIGGRNIWEYSFIFFRRVGENRNLAYIITRVAKKYGIDFCDKIYDVTNEPGKLKQSVDLAFGGVQVPKTYFASLYNDNNINKAIDFLNLPIIAKNLRGKQGAGVFLANSKKELKKIAFDNIHAGNLMLQEFIPNTFDYRILVLGNDIVCAEKRTRTSEKEFRNNVALGGTEEFIDIQSLPKEISSIALKAASVANIQIAGVDVVESNKGEAYIFEVNRSPAFTHDESISPELHLLTEYLIQCDKKNQK